MSPRIFAEIPRIEPSCSFLQIASGQGSLAKVGSEGRGWCTFGQQLIEDKFGASRMSGCQLAFGTLQRSNVWASLTATGQPRSAGEQQNSKGEAITPGGHTVSGDRIASAD
ncbi:hypothetical protein [Qipengyuania soli]|uniref:hypothetical protein n=1 Tax=Qipengyuania soli TaxID=2782568 RepID=UPI001FE67CAB|nr:hypothetical protein [Qipengyuania soli]